MMLAARRLGASTMALLAYANSGDTTGEKRRVVGYGALAAAVPQASTLTLDAAARASLLGLARRSIREYLDVGRVTPAASASPSSSTASNNPTRTPPRSSAKRPCPPRPSRASTSLPTTRTSP